MNKNIKSKATEKKHKLTFIDIGIWLITICLIIAGAFLLLSNLFDWKEQSENGDVEKNVLYVVELKNLTPEQAAHINSDADVNLVIDGQKDKLSCKISNLETTSGSQWQISSDGESMIFIEDTSKVNAFVTFELASLYREGAGYFVANSQLLVGNKVVLEFESINLSGECVAITVKE